MVLHTTMSQGVPWIAVACVVLVLACPAHGTSRGISSSGGSSISDPHSMEGFQQARYYLSNDDDDGAAGGEAIIVEEGGDISETERDSITQSMLAQVALVFGSLLGGNVNKHHHKHDDDDSPPTYQPPSWVPPGGYPYAPSPSGGGKELPFTTGSTVSIRSPALNKYCKVSKDTNLLQCDQDEPSTFMDGLLVLGENYMTNKIMEGDTITLKVQPQNTVCGVDDSSKGSPIKCEGRNIEANAHFTARFAPGSSKDAPTVQLLPATEEEDDEPWGLVGEDDEEEGGWFDVVDMGADVEYDYDYYNEDGESDGEADSDGEEDEKEESESSSSSEEAAETAEGDIAADGAAGAAGEGSARRRLLSGTISLGEGEDKQAVLEEMKELNNEDAKKEGVYEPKSRKLQEKKAVSDLAQGKGIPLEGDKEAILKEMLKQNNADASKEEVYKLMARHLQGEEADESMDGMEAEETLVVEDTEHEEAEAEEGAWAMQELAGSMEGFVEELEEELPAVDYEAEKRKKAKKERLCAPSEDGHAHTVECTKHRADERITFLEIVPTNPYA